MFTIINFFRTLIAVIKDPDMFLAFRIYVKGLHELLLPDQGVVIDCENEKYIIHKFCEDNEWVVGIMEAKHAISSDGDNSELENGTIIKLTKMPEDK